MALGFVAQLAGVEVTSFLQRHRSETARLSENQAREAADVDNSRESTTLFGDLRAVEGRELLFGCGCGCAGYLVFVWRRSGGWLREGEWSGVD